MKVRISPLRMINCMEQEMRRDIYNEERRDAEVDPIDLYRSKHPRLSSPHLSSMKAMSRR